MPSLLTTKTLGIIGGIAGVSAIGGGIAYESGLFSDSKPEKVVNNKTKLEDEGFEVLNKDSDSAEWGKILTAYHKATKGTFKTDGTLDANRTQQELIDECQRQLALNTDPSYKLTRQWCVKQETMSTILGRKSKVLITNETTTDDDKWKLKINNLTEAEKRSLNVKIDTVVATNISSIKAGCKAVTDKNTTDPEFNEKFEVAKKVCTV